MAENAELALDIMGFLWYNISEGWKEKPTNTNKEKGEANMKTGLRILEAEVKNTRSLKAYSDKVRGLREAEREAEQQGNIEAALQAFTVRMELIAAGPGASQAPAWA